MLFTKYTRRARNKQVVFMKMKSNRIRFLKDGSSYENWCPDQKKKSCFETFFNFVNIWQEKWNNLWLFTVMRLVFLQQICACSVWSIQNSKQKAFGNYIFNLAFYTRHFPIKLADYLFSVNIPKLRQYGPSCLTGINCFVLKSNAVYCSIVFSNPIESTECKIN